MPEMVQPSNKTVTATQFGPACPQPDMDRLKTSEDCLLVNVWIPEVGFLFELINVLVFFLLSLFRALFPTLLSRFSFDCQESFAKTFVSVSAKNSQCHYVDVILPNLFFFYNISFSIHLFFQSIALSLLFIL